MTVLLPKYKFIDISVFMKTENGYINLTDFSIIDFKENERKKFQSEAKYLITFHSFLLGIYQHLGDAPYTCEVTIDELKALTGVSANGNSFWRKFSDEEQVALFCAKKILEYQYGAVQRTGERTYGFYRLTQKKENGAKAIKKQELVFEREFKETSYEKEI